MMIRQMLMCFVLAMIGSVVLAVAADVVLLALERLLTPWARVRRA